MTPIHIGLVADPYAPTELARRLDDLGMPEPDGQGWDIEVLSEPFTVGSEETGSALARLKEQARQHHWDLVVGLTELPLHDGDGRYLLIETDPAQRTAVLSMPALGGVRMQARARRALRELVSGMADPRHSGRASGRAPGHP